MKLQLKLIAAAALIAVAGSASASIPLVSNPASGSDLFFYVFDDVTKTSYLQDLGVTMAAFVAAPSSITATVGASYASYLTSVGNNTSNSYWGILAGDYNAAAKGLLSTLRATDGSTPTSTTLAKIKSAVGTPLSNVVIGVNGQTSDATTGYFSASAAGDNIANNFGHNGAGNLQFRTDNLIGTGSVFSYENLNLATVQPVTLGSATFNGSSINLAVAAVPEPTTYAMMIAGLLLVGGIARRRNSAK